MPMFLYNFKQIAFASLQLVQWFSDSLILKLYFLQLPTYALTPLEPSEA